ncbi:hypothetical protein ETAA8_17870 [Anatilimnocola aggregata]|uniref:HMA domain-containing protein n=1 Tax=Anatilimnocola aggregata TaxID=2528021 RepID=A0A517Y903_9BACT|nr:hypothetical protein ETAA8_17870 [Anatilimnocola aggregata]
MKINHLHESLLLFSVSAVVAMVLCYADPLQKKSRQAILLVENMCCDLRAGDVAKELSKVTGVTSTRQSIADREIQITVHGDAPVLHASLWSAAEKARVRPVKLIVDGRVIAQQND